MKCQNIFLIICQRIWFGIEDLFAIKYSAMIFTIFQFYLNYHFLFILLNIFYWDESKKKLFMHVRIPCDLWQTSDQTELGVFHFFIIAKSCESFLSIFRIFLTNTYKQFSHRNVQTMRELFICTKRVYPRVSSPWFLRRYEKRREKNNFEVWSFKAFLLFGCFSALLDGILRKTSIHFHSHSNQTLI